MPNEFIFVYGTLRKQTATVMHHLLADHCEYFSDGYMLGKLYEIGGYPGAIESDNTDDQVTGELYKVDSRGGVLKKLDEYEQCSDDYPQPREYVRKKLSITLPDGRPVLAWVYVFNHDISGFNRINSGDYLSFLKEGG